MLMSEELTKIIPIEPIDSSKLSIKRFYQYDTSSQEDQILLRVLVEVKNNGGLFGVVNSWRVVKDLNTLITNKDFTGISRGDCAKMLDSSYGSKDSRK
jgi:hypothetical protein